MEEYLGMIKQFAGMRQDFLSYGFQNYLPCDGRLLNVSHYAALFSIIGNMYGGDGITNFKLPDLLPKNEEGKILHIKVGEIHNGVPYIPYYICINGIYPSTN